jgi:hypothetical protein
MRKLMLLVEQANTHTQEDLEKQLVTLIRDYLAHEDNEDTSNSEWLEDHMDYLIKKNPELSQLVKTHNLDDKVTNRKWLNAVFTKHMGKTIKEFERLAQKQLDQQAMAQADPQTIKFLKAIGTGMTATLSPRDVKHLAWYAYSPKKIVITMPDNLNVPNVFWGDKAAAHFGMSLEEIKQALVDMGIKQIKKPKAYKSSPSYYD